MNASFKNHPLMQLVATRLRELIRTPEAVFWGYVFPLVMVVALGLAFRSKPVEIISVDVQAGPGAEAIKRTLEKVERFRVLVGTEDDCRRRLRTGDTELIVIAETPSVSTSEAPLEARSKSASPTVRYLFDPTRPGSLLARNSTDDALQRDAGRQDIVVTENTEVSEPGSRYIDFLVPGLIGMGIMGGGLWGLGFAIVDLRVRQVLKRYLGTPMKKGHFLGAMIIARLAFVIPEFLVLLLFSHFFFGVICHGSLVTLLMLVLIGAFEFAAIGLLIASRTQTQEGVMGLMNLVTIPMWVGSGIFFSTNRFPDFAQPVLNVLPLKPLIGAFRQVMLEGAGWIEVAPQLAIVLAWAVVSFVLALRLFRWN
ncbi:MAG: ABC transporter permease [Planctomycetota bacterium]|nr:ABC transporter permease [Planctomycetota bacterium]